MIGLCLSTWWRHDPLCIGIHSVQVCMVILCPLGDQRVSCSLTFLGAIESLVGKSCGPGLGKVDCFGRSSISRFRSEASEEP